MRLFIAAATLLLTAAGAHAACVVAPSETSWDGVQKNTGQAVCLQRELSQDTDDRAWQVRVQTQLDALARNEVQLRQQFTAPVFNGWN